MWEQASVNIPSIMVSPDLSVDPQPVKHAENYTQINPLFFTDRLWG